PTAMLAIRSTSSSGVNTFPCTRTSEMISGCEDVLGACWSNAFPSQVSIHHRGHRGHRGPISSDVSVFGQMARGNSQLSGPGRLGPFAKKTLGAGRPRDRRRNIPEAQKSPWGEEVGPHGCDTSVDATRTAVASTVNYPAEHEEWSWSRRGGNRDRKAGT